MKVVFKKITQDFYHDAVAVMNDGIETLRQAGSTQWQFGHPNVESIKKYLAQDVLHGLFSEEDNLIGICALLETPELSYQTIEGAWLTQEDAYLTIHLVAIGKAYLGQGYSYLLLEEAIQYAQNRLFKSVRVDTHRLNISMQTVLKKLNFSYCGVIHLEHLTIDSERLAYELVIPYHAT